MSRVGSTATLCTQASGVGTLYSRYVAFKAASAILACLICATVGGSESGPKKGASGPKYFSSAAPSAPSCSGPYEGWNIFLSPVIVGRNSCHCAEVLPRLLIIRSKLWHEMHVARIMRISAVSGNRLSNSAPLRRVYRLPLGSESISIGRNINAPGRNRNLVPSIILRIRGHAQISRRCFHDGSANRLARAILDDAVNHGVRGRERRCQAHHRTARNHDTAEFTQNLLHVLSPRSSWSSSIFQLYLSSSK